MIETSRGIPEFDEHGNLPYNCYEVTLDEIEEHFVNSFPLSKSRKSRFECFLNFYRELTKNVKSCIRIIIDGSFVENNPHPFDIDLVVVVDYERANDYEINYLITECDYNDIIKKEYLLLKNQVEKGNENFSSLFQLEFYQFGCDIHFFLKYPINHPLYKKGYEDRLNYWIGLFGKDRKEFPKGFLNLVVDYGGNLNE